MEYKKFKKIKIALPETRENVLLKNHTTYKIGGPAKYFFIAKKKEDLISALKTAKKFKIPIFILGGGSNLLVSDKGFNGLVIKVQSSKIKVQNYSSKFKNIYVDAGVKLSDLVDFCTENGLSGLEWAAGIPNATLGGAIFGHAQAFGEKISDYLESVEVLDLKTLKIKKLSRKQCQFSLKNSIFKKNKNLAILSAVFSFEKGGKQKIQEKTKEFLDYRKNNHPMDFPSAGSIFVNPEIKIKDKNLLAEFPELNKYNKKGIIPAGYLIAKCGLAGKKIGKAQISEKHANFIINLGDAKATDVLGLIKLAKQKVKEKFNINLETEIQLIGF